MQILDWQQLDDSARRNALVRPLSATRDNVSAQAAEIIAAVRSEGDAALRRLSRQFDGVELDMLRVSADEFQAARAELEAADIAALENAIRNVRAFHIAQLPPAIDMETQPGVRCERLTRAIASVGLYVPAGSAPLPSTVIMLAVPAAIAGCAQRVLCTPAQRNGRANAAVLVAAQLCGIDTVFKVGGAQAIAAMAYGTESVPKVLKIFGPGNAWVTAAKQLAAADPAGAALDMPAGPSEVMVIADENANAEFVAADLLAQAEHDPGAQAVLLTNSKDIARRVAEQLAAQLKTLSRTDILRQSSAAIRIVVMPDLDAAFALADEHAPEHLLIQVREPRSWLPRINTAGSVFLGNWTPETMGDYCSGTNHVLPTYGYARTCSGLSVLDFTRRMTVQELSAQGLKTLGPVAARLARLEGLDAHEQAVTRRLRSAELAS